METLDPEIPAGRALLGDGYRVEAQVVVWKKGDAIKAPSGSLFRNEADGGWSVYRVVEGPGVAKACGVEGVTVSTMDELRDALAKAVDAQMNDGVTTFIEVLLNQELGEPFRRDAMKKPVSVAGISQADMRPQQGA